MLAVRELKLPHIPVIAQTPKQFEVYMAYKWMASGGFERVNKDTSLDLFAQEVARRVDEEKKRARRSRTIPSPSPLAENRLLMPAICTSNFGKAPLLDGRDTENTGKEMETERGHPVEERVEKKQLENKKKRKEVKGVQQLLVLLLHPLGFLPLPFILQLLLLHPFLHRMLPFRLHFLFGVLRIPAIQQWCFSEIRGTCRWRPNSVFRKWAG